MSINYHKKPLMVRCLRSQVSINIGGTYIVLTPKKSFDVSSYGTPKELEKSNIKDLVRRRLVRVD